MGLECAATLVVPTPTCTRNVSLQGLLLAHFVVRLSVNTDTLHTSTPLSLSLSLPLTISLYLCLPLFRDLFVYASVRACVQVTYTPLSENM